MSSGLNFCAAAQSNSVHVVNVGSQLFGKTIQHFWGLTCPWKMPTWFSRFLISNLPNLRPSCRYQGSPWPYIKQQTRWAAPRRFDWHGNNADLSKSKARPASSSWQPLRLSHFIARMCNWPKCLRSFNGLAHVRITFSSMITRSQPTIRLRFGFCS